VIILHIWKAQPGNFFCLSTKGRDGTWKDHFFKRSQLKDVPQFIEENLDKDLYWCPHGFNKPRRLKKYAEIPKLLWADLDEANPRDMEDLMPSVAWESSPGRYAAVWVLDKFMVEDLNRRLTYHLKADPGGWDLTQVLRVPGTTNYKYTSTPKVRLLWSDGPSYKFEEIERRLPQERKVKEHDVARGLYRKYEKNLPGWVRRELLRGKPKQGKRSEVMWRLAHSLLEAGMSRDEAFELLRVSPWNKFAKRRDGDEQLKRELEKALSQHVLVEDDENPTNERYGDESEEDEDEPYTFLAQPMSEVEEENISWLWYPYLARGEVTILEGDPGLGKSYLAQMVAMGICDSAKLPSVKAGMPAGDGKIAYFDIENSTASVTKKRLVSNGARRMDRFYQEPEPFSIGDPEVMERVYEAIDKLRPALVVFDTLGTYMGGADTHNASETAQMFKGFVEIARRFRCAVLVLRHLTKSKDSKALYRGQGSIAFAGLARIVITVGRMPEDPEVKVMAVTKLNVARHPRALTFTIESLPDTIKDQDRSKFSWGEFVDVSADDIVSAPPPEKEDKELDRTCEWLRESLNGQGATFAALTRMAAPRSITDKMIRKAAAELGVVQGDKWTLPKEEKK
jgi:hypothetical protein